MASHTFSHADELYVGNAKHPRTARRGIPVTPILQIDLGAPVAGAANSICASQAVNADVAATLDGSTAGALDVPRNVVAAWTGAAVITVTGIDAYGQRVTESSASGTSFTGKKAFKTVTSVTFSANVTGATVGTGNVLGLPYRIAGRWDVLGFYADGSVETVAALVAGDATTPSATTGDVRGTITPTTTPNGSIRFRAWMKVFGLKNDAESFGRPQYAA